MLKSLVGSLIGGTIGFGIHYVLKQGTGDTYIWFPIVTGLLTGLVARMFAGRASSNSAGLASGLVAAVVALVAIFGVDLVGAIDPGGTDFGPVDRKAQVAKNNTNDATPPIAESEAVESDTTKAMTPDKEEDKSDVDNNIDAKTENEADSVDTQSDNAAGNENAAPQAPGQDPTAESSQPPQSDNIRAVLDSGNRNNNHAKPPFYLPFLYSVIGVFLAYQIARGFGTKQPHTTGEPSSDIPSSNE